MRSDLELEMSARLDAEGLGIERRVDGALAFEIPEKHGPVSVPLSPEYTVEIEIPPNPTVRVFDGREFPQLDVALVLAQPEVVKQDPRRGWFPIGGDHYDSELEFGEPESTLVFERSSGEVCVWGETSSRLDIERTGAFPLFVVVRPK